MTIQKRNNSYLVAVSGGYNEKGKQIRHTKTFTPPDNLTPKQAEKWINAEAVEFEKNIKQGLTSKKLKLSELFKNWDENHLAVNLAKKTAQEYRKLWGRLEPHLGHLYTDNVTPTHIQRVYTSFQKDGSNLKTGGKVDISHFHSMLSSMFGYAVKMGFMTNNPTERVLKPKAEKKKPAVLTKQQAITLLNNLEFESLEFQAIFSIGLCCGLRRSEIHGLKWSDIDGGTIWVKRSISYITGQGQIEKTTKTGDERPARLPQAVINILISYKEEQQQRIINLGDKFIDNDYIFTQDNGQPRTSERFAKKLKKYMLKSGFDENTIKNIHVHTLRHTFATLLLRSGTDIRTTAGLMGHSQPTLTLNTYGHFLLESIDSGVQIFNNLINA